MVESPSVREGGSRNYSDDVVSMRQRLKTMKENKSLKHAADVSAAKKKLEQFEVHQLKEKEARRERKEEEKSRLLARIAPIPNKEDRRSAHRDAAMQTRLLLSSRKDLKQQELTQVVQQYRDRLHMPSKKKIMQQKSAVPSSHLGRKPSISREQRAANHRRHVAMELMTTEKKYLHSLLTLIAVFRTPLLSFTRKGNDTNASAYMSQDQIAIVFKHVDELTRLSGELLKSLMELVMQWNTDQNVGPVFLDVVPRLVTVYCGYVTNFHLATTTVSTLSASSEPFRRFLDECRRNAECGMLGLLEIMLTPVQRVPRYKLLLEDMLKHTPATHKSFDEITLARDKVGELATLMNEAKRVSEEQKQVVLIAKQIDGMPETILEKQRRLLCEHEFEHLRTSNNPKNSSMIGRVKLILFSDCVVIAKPHKTKWRSSASVKWTFAWMGDLDGLVLSIESDQVFMLKKAPDMCFVCRYIRKSSTRRTTDEFVNTFLEQKRKMVPESIPSVRRSQSMAPPTACDLELTSRIGPPRKSMSSSATT